MNPWFTPPTRETMMIKPEKFARKPFVVDAFQVTEENAEAVAKWCLGEVRKTRQGDNGEFVLYVKVRVLRPLNERQTKAYIGDWVLHSGAGFKVYTGKAFESTFERAHDDEYDKVFTNPADKDLTLFQETVSGSHPIVNIREEEGHAS
jgi:hypothetical protein